jgi:hypothetical protein
MVLKLFNKQTIFSLVDILFSDMADDKKKLDDPDSKDPNSDSNHNEE